MTLTLKRRFKGPNYTIGTLCIDGEWFSDTLEDPDRDLNQNGKFDNGEFKVYGNTCIPYGKYKIILNYSNKFKRVLPLLLDVPNFEGIRIHRGNTPKDTLGCILVGENKVKGQVINSTKYEEKLVDILKKAIDNNQSITINII